MLFLGTALPFAAEAQGSPTVAIASPAPNATVCGTITVAATAFDSYSIAGVQFKYNGINLGAEDTAAPYQVTAFTNSAANGPYTFTAVARNVLGEQTTSAPVTVTVENPSSRPCKFIPTFLMYYGAGQSFVAGDEQKLGKFDLLDVDRFRYSELSPNTWDAVKGFNPIVQIYLYEMGPEVTNFHDNWNVFHMNDLGRYDVSRGHSMGSLNGNLPGMYLLDAQGNRIYNVGHSNVATNQYSYLMDFGSSAYQSYWVEAVKADIVDQPWVADGVHADNCIALEQGGGYSATATRYPTNAAWSDAMNSFVEAIATGVRGYGQKLWCNRGETRLVDGSAAWLALDNAASPPDVLLEEGAFAVQWGSDTQFYPEAEWKRQVDTMGAIRNSKVAMLSHTKLMDGESGTDNWGQPVSFGQSLWYSMGSFLLGRNDQLNNAYFMFAGRRWYDTIWWYDEYDMIDLGRAVGPYGVTAIGETNVYWREFERGYVVVNPTPNDVASVALPQPCRQRTQENLYSPPSSLPVITAVPLKGHHAAILLKD